MDKKIVRRLIHRLPTAGKSPCVAAVSMCRGAFTSLRNICTLSGAESSVREQDLSPRPKLELGRLRSGQKLIYRPLRNRNRNNRRRWQSYRRRGQGYRHARQGHRSRRQGYCCRRYGYRSGGDRNHLRRCRCAKKWDADRDSNRGWTRGRRGRLVAGAGA